MQSRKCSLSTKWNLHRPSNTLAQHYTFGAFVHSWRKTWHNFVKLAEMFRPQTGKEVLLAFTKQTHTHITIHNICIYAQWYLMKCMIWPYIVHQFWRYQMLDAQHGNLPCRPSGQSSAAFHPAEWRSATRAFWALPAWYSNILKTPWYIIVFYLCVGTPAFYQRPFAGSNQSCKSPPCAIFQGNNLEPTSANTQCLCHLNVPVLCCHHFIKNK